MEHDARDEQASCDAIPSAIHERRRSEFIAKIPRWYSPALHLAIPTVLGLFTMGASLARIAARGQLRAIDLLAVPASLLFAFGFEWRVHKDVLHRRVPLLGTLYVRHELIHHVIYTSDDMAMRSPRELRLILMPAYAVILVFLIDLPFALAAGALFGPNAGCLVLATSMFFVTYEWLHCAYHLPRDSRLGRSPILMRLRRLHQRHHDPRLMKRWNFNVTFPVFDWIHGTNWSPARAAIADTERAERRRRAAPPG